MISFQTMGNRSRIYTRTGDQGTTGLANAERRAKHDQRFAAIGAVDELNALIGLAAAGLDDSDMRADLEQIQKTLFTIGAMLALAEGIEPATSAVEQLEQRIDAYDSALPQMTHFILPGGTGHAARLHHARTVCRRAEREILHLSTLEHVNLAITQYMNRLSDLLFVMARLENHRRQIEELKWIPE